MKRFTMILALLLMLAMPMMAERVAPETARKVATTFLNNNGAKADQLTDLSKTAGFTNLYIFTTENSFVVMAADDRVNPILGYSLTEKFETKGMPENLIWWLQGYSDQIQDMIDNNRSNDAAVATEWQSLKNGSNSKSISEIIVEPLLTTTWDQNYPYNYSCPSDSDGPGGHVYAGCVATAMAQVMKFWNYPTMGNGSHSYTSGSYGEQTANFGETTYDWDNMTNSISNSSDQANIDAIATLIYHCGVAVDMNYGKGSSGASSSKVPAALIDYFNYAPSAAYISRDGFEDDQWIAFLQSELLEGRPLLYSGSYSFQNNGQTYYGGHSFVCDGYRSDNYFHFNWGWSGYNGNGSTDGFWLIGALNPGSAGSGSGSGTYNLNNTVAAWVEPISSLNAPSLTASVSNNNVTLTWDAVDDATSYDVYKDNAKIAADLTSLSYVDNNIGFGQYPEYYLRAKNSTTKSNPSNRVIATGTYHNLIPQNPTATIAISDNSVNLSWTEPQSQSMNMHYGIGQSNSYYGSGLEDGTYWGQCYPSDYISAFGGMVIDHVSIYLGFPGDYSLFLYQDNVTLESNLLASKDFTGTIGWNDIILDNNIPLDLTKDLWVVFHTSNTIQYPAYYGEYNGVNKEHAHYLWYDFSNNGTYTLPSNISWPIKIHLTDGTFTYNVYRNNILIAEHLTNTTYQDGDLSDGTIEYYISTYTNNWESEGSEVVSIDYTTEHRISDAITISDDLTLSNQNRYIIESTGFLTVSGALSNTDPANLILENGAQLVHNSADVKATVKKDIAAINDEQGWNFVASPVTESIEPSTENGFLNGTLEDNVYDLYYYDEPSHYWMNYESNANSFVIEHKKGYLYANGDDTSLQFEGTLTPSNNTVTISNLSCQASELNGFNLVGNPFACNATIDQDCYIIDNAEGKVVLAEQGPVIAPCEGVFVKATASENSVTFTKSTDAKVNRVRNCFDLVIGQNRNNDGVHTTTTTIVDRARVRFSEGIGMEKYSMDNKHSQISLLQDGQDFAVAYANGEKEMPLNFKAVKNGTYTLSIEAEELELGYLHIIDNLTGNDVDLLATPSYTFEANTSDFPTRFKLLFAPICEDADGDNATFAYISDGNIIVNNANEASLQIVDMMGRVVVEGDTMNPVSTSEMTSGVYVLRLINGEKVQTQKIVIE